MGELLMDIGLWFIAIGITLGLFMVLLWVLAKLCEILTGDTK